MSGESSESSGSRIMRSLANGKGAITLQAGTLAAIVGGVWMGGQKLGEMASHLRSLEAQSKANSEAIAAQTKLGKEQAERLKALEELLDRSRSHEEQLRDHEDRIGANEQALIDAKPKKRR